MADTPVTDESIAFCKEHFVKAEAYIREGRLTLPLTHNIIIDGFNSMVYRAAVFYNNVVQYRDTIDIEEFARQLELFEEHKQGIELYTQNKKSRAKKHLESVANCTGPVSYFKLMTGAFLQQWEIRQ